MEERNINSDFLSKTEYLQEQLSNVQKRSLPKMSTYLNFAAVTVASSHFLVFSTTLCHQKVASIKLIDRKIRAQDQFYVLYIYKVIVFSRLWKSLVDHFGSDTR